MVTLILPSSRCHRPCVRRPHCRPKAARSKLKPTLLKPYLFRNVIRNPKPMKIMTWTSWNTGDMRREVSAADDLVAGRWFVFFSAECRREVELYKTLSHILFVVFTLPLIRNQTGLLSTLNIAMINWAVARLPSSHFLPQGCIVSPGRLAGKSIQSHCEWVSGKTLLLFLFLLSACDLNELNLTKSPEAGEVQHTLIY